MPSRPPSFLEIDFRQVCKAGQPVCGDVFTSRRVVQEERVVSVLADGLGSGIKAGVLATLTGTMAMRCVAGAVEARRTAELIMAILPVCKERRLAYSTFTIADAGPDGSLVLVEYGNPPALWIRAGRIREIPRQRLQVQRPDGQQDELWFSRIQAYEGDRLVLCSDGVTQAGLGAAGSPLGWGLTGLQQALIETLERDLTLSARRLAERVLAAALARDGGVARDDMTCGVLSLRRPRHLLVVTGPPMDRRKDPEMARRLDAFDGQRVVCGGTTAELIARELQRPIALDLTDSDPRIPPASRMQGAALVTEGTLTLAETLRLLEDPAALEKARPHAARRLVEIMQDSDIIQFLVGTRINDAHQDPQVPVELDIRRNLVRRMRQALEISWLKKTGLEYI